MANRGRGEAPTSSWAGIAKGVAPREFARRLRCMSETADLAKEPELGRIGVCIYCGSTENLTDEHVIPFALGGVAQLRDASCDACREVTSKFERLVLREQLGLFRARKGLPTQHPRNRPTEVEVRVRTEAGWKDARMPIQGSSAAGLFPRFPPPGVVVGRAPGAPIPLKYVAVILSAKDEIGHDFARRVGVEEVSQTAKAYPAEFMQMLAKIAWGFSVSLIGLDRLDPAILGVIQGTDPDPSRWVGCPHPGASSFDAPAAEGPPLQVRVGEVGPYVLSGIRLFADDGAPEYLVVVGRTKAAWR